MSHVPAGIYLLVDPDQLAEAQWELVLPAVLAAGVVLVQLRTKSSSTRARRRQAHTLRAICTAADRPLLINDDIALAQAVAADGVHLGQSDGAIHTARACLGPAAIIGRTCHADSALIQAAAADGADYASVGAIYPSATKPGARAIGIDRLRQAVQHSPLPVCAIGGIAAPQVAEIRAAGAQLIAVCGAILRAPDPALSARNLVRSWADASDNLTL